MRDTESRPPPRRELSDGRKALYYGGLFLTIAGMALCVGMMFMLITGRGFGPLSASHGQRVVTLPGGEKIKLDGPGFPGAPSNSPFGSPDFPRPMIGFFVGMVLAGVGQGLMRLGRQGVAGSGLLLDPQKARQDLEPWSRMRGGMAADALDEVHPLRDLTQALHKNAAAAASPGEPVVKVRCPSCRALADESARFCPQCGKPL